MVRRLIVPILLVATSSMQACGFSLSTTSPRVRLDLQFEQTVRSTDMSPVETEETVRGLPPVLQQIADERRQFQMNLGKAMDTLRKDMPYILKRSPGEMLLAFARKNTLVFSFSDIRLHRFLLCLLQRL
jgi:hypothetical protein